MENAFTGLAIVAVCLCLSAFFSATETALTSLSVLKTKHMRESQGARGRVLDLWIQKPHRVLASVLVGNNLVNIFAAIYTDNLVESALGKHSVTMVTGIMTAIIVLFCEILPKTLAKNAAAEVAIPFLSVFRFFYYVLLPFTTLFTILSEAITRLITSKSAKPAPQITEEELEFLINVGEEEGVLGDEKHEMLSGIFELGDTVVREIMVHRIDVKAIPSDAPAREALDLCRRTGLSRLPVFKGELDHVVGIVHAKDLMALVLRSPSDLQAPVGALQPTPTRSPLFVPESKPVDQLFQEMRKQRQHLAVVLDEYGSVSGLVTMEDILEEIVGEVRDEFDDEEDAIRPTHVPGQFLVECKIHIDDFCETFELDAASFALRDGGGNYDTLGGLIIHHFGQIPKMGDRLTVSRVSLEVIEVSRRRVRKVLVRVEDTNEPREEERSAAPGGAALEGEAGAEAQSSSSTSSSSSSSSSS